MGSLYVSVDLQGITVFALVDSGSTISVIHPDVLAWIPGMVDADIERPGGELRMADGGVIRTSGSVNLCMKIGTDNLSMKHKMVVAPVEVPVVLGRDFLRAHGCILDVDGCTLRVGAAVHAYRSITDMPACYHISMTETVVVPPRSEMIIPGVVLGNPHFTAAMIESGDIPLCGGRVALAKMLVNPFNSDALVRLMNLGNQPETLPEGLVLGSCGPVRVLADDDIPDGSEDAWRRSWSISLLFGWWSRYQSSITHDACPCWIREPHHFNAKTYGSGYVAGGAGNLCWVEGWYWHHRCLISWNENGFFWDIQVGTKKASTIAVWSCQGRTCQNDTSWGHWTFQ